MANRNALGKNVRYPHFARFHAYFRWSPLRCFSLRPTTPQTRMGLQLQATNLYRITT